MSPARRRLVSAVALDQGSAALAGRHGARTDRPALRKNLIVRKQVQMGDVSWVVKIPDTTKLYVLDDAGWGILQLFDGDRGREEIADEYNRLHPGAGVGVPLVLEYEEFARGMELLETSAAERSLRLLSKYSKDARRKAAEEKAEGFNVFFLMFNVFDPDRFLTATVRFVRWFWTPPAVAVALIGFVFTVSIFAGHFPVLWTETLELYAFLKRPFWDIVQFWTICTIIGAIHELGHAYATKIYGGEVHEIGIALLYFMPAFYTDTTDSLLFDKRQRFWVNVAGVYVEGTLCTVATALWVASYPDTLLHELAYKTMLYTGISTVFFNANPLIKIDGYHAMTSIIGVPELREESIQYLGALFQRHVLRLPVSVPVLSRRKRRVFLTYAPFALVYTGVIMLFIGRLFSNFYARYFPNLVVLLVALTMYRIFRKRVRVVTRTAKLFYLDKKELLMSPRARGPLLGALAVLLVVLAVPWSRRSIQQDVLLAPGERDEVPAPEDATVDSVSVHEGDTVGPGQVLFTLSNVSLESQIARLAVERDRLVKEASQRNRGPDSQGAFRAEREKAAVEARLQSEERRKERLAVRSPRAGRVLTRHVEDLAGRYVRSGTVLAEVGDSRRLVAEIRVSERLVPDLESGQPVSLRLHARPLEVTHGSIVSVSPAAFTERQEVSPDRSLSPEAQRITRPPDRPGRFVVVARFENPDGRLLPGMSGTARIHLKRASYLDRSWRVLRHWIQTIFW